LPEIAGLGRVLIVNLQQSEFVAANAGNGFVAVKLAFNAGRDLAEQAISDRMSKRVVDVLEIVEVEVKQRQSLTDAACFIHSR
jgi:hypothetical protein